MNAKFPNLSNGAAPVFVLISVVFVLEVLLSCFWPETKTNSRVIIAIKLVKAISLIFIAIETFSLYSFLTKQLKNLVLEHYDVAVLMDKLRYHFIVGFFSCMLAFVIVIYLGVSFFFKEFENWWYSVQPWSSFLFELAAFMPILLFMHANLRLRAVVSLDDNRHKTLEYLNIMITRFINFVDGPGVCVFTLIMIFSLYFNLFTNLASLLFVSGAIAAIVFMTVIAGARVHAITKTEVDIDPSG